MIEDFILVKDNVFPKEYCNAAIEYFLDMEKAGFAANRVQLRGEKPHEINDTNVALHGEDSVKIDGTQGLNSFFLEKFWTEVYPEYVQKYSIIDNFDEHKIYCIKLQRTRIGEAYHKWHCETETRDMSNRFMTFICYLNDIQEGGETEFLYYPKRIKAEMGKIILFPGHFTHTHRGNPPLTNEKYILTGWVEF